jgi:hypothetical protein
MCHGATEIILWMLSSNCFRTAAKARKLRRYINATQQTRPPCELIVHIDRSVFVKSFNGTFRASAWMLTGSLISKKQRGSSKPGARNTMRVVLTESAGHLDRVVALQRPS